MALQQHYVDLMNVLQPHVEDIAFSACYHETLIPSETKEIIILSPAMPLKRKVTKLLCAIQESITDNNKLLLRFVEMLKKWEACVELMGDRLFTTYCECIIILL